MPQPDRNLTSLGASRLEALLESAQLLHSSLDLADLLSHLLRSVMGRMLVSRAFIAVEEDGVVQLALIRGLPGLKVGTPYSEEEVRNAGIDHIFSIGDEAQPVGWLGIGRPMNRTVDGSETEFVKALLGIAASGIENARSHTETRRLNEDLDQKVQDLRTLLDLVRGFTSSLDPDGVARLLTLTLTGRWAVRKYAVIAHKRGHPTVTRGRGIEFSHPEEILPQLAGLPEVAAVEELPEGALKDSLIAQGTKVVFIMRASDEPIGVIALGPRPGNLQYENSDLEFGAGLVAQAAVAFVNSWYFREAIERRRMEQELELAASIQENLFPASITQLTGCAIAAKNRPARECGGDYYDALPVGTRSEDSPYLFCVADVSGKGLPASLLMSNMQATLRALLGRIPNLTDLAAHTNELLYASTPSNKYVTAILAEFDPISGRGRFVNAGHTDCLLLRASGEAIWLKATGTPLGLIPDMPYEEEAIELHAGDLLALYSDGVTEAQDVDENEFGEQRLADFLRPLADMPVETLVAKVFEEVDRFAGKAPQYDDITLLILKRVHDVGGR
ncbi:MAG: PP2C family protein-serine/threonine phosphatase [Acidobacteriota bacterium]